MNNPLVQPDPGLFIWTIVTFLVLVWLLGKFAWRPMLQALERRHQTIEAAVDDARRTKEELARVQQDSARLLAQARLEADALVTRARGDADRFREEMREKAKVDAEVITRNAERQIERETARAITQIRHEAVDLSLAIASKVLGRTISRADNEHLLEEVISQLEKRPS